MGSDEIRRNGYAVVACLFILLALLFASEASGADFDVTKAAIRAPDTLEETEEALDKIIKKDRRAIAVGGVAFVFSNTTGEVVHYWLYRLSRVRREGWNYAPSIKRWIFSAAGGELQPGATRKGPGGYPPGEYAIGWRLAGHEGPIEWPPLWIRPGTGMVKLTPSGARAYMGL